MGCECSDQVCWWVLEIVQLVDGVWCLLQGLDIVVGCFGVCLLGGQWQCLVIVWMIFVEFKVVIFDEVILVFDVVIEYVLYQVFGDFFEGCIILIVVYWLLVVKQVDWVLVFDGGYIVEDGDYQ